MWSWYFDRQRKALLKKYGRRRIFIAVGLLAFVGVCISGARFWLMEEEPADEIHAASAAEESEAKKIEAALADKPDELRKSLSEYAETSTDVREILTKRLEKKNIGGAVAVAVTNFQKNSHERIDTPEELGFKRIENEKALVNRALKGDVDILAVTVTHTGEHLFHVTIDVKNNTGSPLECVIPKGQLVEIRNGKNTLTPGVVHASYNHTRFPQTGANTRDIDGPKTVVPRWEPAKIEFDAYCANPYLVEPEGAANLAIFALDDTSYNSWDELRELRIKKLNLATKTSLGQT